MLNISWRRKALNVLCLLLFAYLITVTYRTYVTYQYIKEDYRGWRRPVYQADPKTGWRPIPLVKSAHVFPVGPDVPTAFDADGFRRPVDKHKSSVRVRPYVLALGCSFTYGDACLAEETFPYKVAHILEGTELNAGLCGAGLAQMVLLAEKHIPKHKPDIVIVQYSPWLTDRSAGYFGPAYHTYAPLPFFVDRSDSSGLRISEPVFLGKDFDMSPWLASKKSPSDFLSFGWTIGIPLNVVNDVNITKFKIKHTLGLVEKPSENKEKVIEFSYNYIKTLCDQTDALMLIVVLGHSASQVKIPPAIKTIGIPIVHAHDALLSALPKQHNGNLYHNTYGHVRGTPPAVIDIHPNPAAHSIIAQSIISTINQLDPKKRFVCLTPHPLM